MACTTSHTAYQPTEAQWKCPHCGAGSEAFWVEENAGVDFDCPLLHKDDEVVCRNCDKFWTGTKIASILKKSLTEKPCPHCKGTGKVFIEPTIPSAEEAVQRWQTVAPAELRFEEQMNWGIIEGIYSKEIARIAMKLRQGKILAAYSDIWTSVRPQGRAEVFYEEGRGE